MEARNSKPHAVCVPYPIQGHIKPMLNLAKLLHHNGFHITFVNTEFNHSRLIKSKGLASLSGLPDFKFAAIPDGLPLSKPDAAQDPSALSKSVTTNFLAPFLNLIEGLNGDKESEKAGRVTRIVSDVLMIKFTVAAAEVLRIPIALFCVVSATAFLTTGHCRTLQEKGLAPFKDESYLTDEAYLNTAINWIPGIEEISLRDFPSFIRTIDQNDSVFHFLLESTERAPKDKVIIFHTCEALEEQVLEALSSYHSHIHTVGPLDLLLKQLPEDPLGSMEGSLWKEDTECLQWLDGHKPNSVIYVNFGTTAMMTPEQIVELGWGLADSKHPFLLVIRPDVVRASTTYESGYMGSCSSDYMFQIFEETRERGMAVSWCPQEKVLNHPSVGGFLTHCGWNSTIESICAGVPMLCWPSFADQYTNCWLSCKQWDIWMEIDNNAKRDGLEKLVRELMEGEKGKEMKKNVMELRRKAFEATSPGGSSMTSLDKLVAALSLN